MNERKLVTELEMIDDVNALAVEKHYTEVLNKKMYVIFDTKVNRICNGFGVSDKRETMLKQLEKYKNRKVSVI